MRNYYQILGVTSAASHNEIRRAYRVLARRYHPDLNPGNSKSEDLFKDISKAYSTLSDDLLRQKYDNEIGLKPKDKQKTASHKKQSSDKSKFNAINKFGIDKIKKFNFSKFINKIKLPTFLIKNENSSKFELKSVSLIEVSITIKDALSGSRKTVEISDYSGKTRKLSILIPAGTKNGSVIKMQSKNPESKKEEIIVIIRIAPHNFLSIQNRGLVYEVPITLYEAIKGTSFTIPIFDRDITIKVPPNTSSGDELRIPGLGLPFQDGSKGDLFIKFMVILPPNAPGLNQIADALFEYYAGYSVRSKITREVF
jgi:curved DNA-binding protein